MRGCTPIHGGEKLGGDGAPGGGDADPARRELPGGGDGLEGDGGGAGDWGEQYWVGGKRSGCPKEASPTPDKTADGDSNRIIRSESG